MGWLKMTGARQLTNRVMWYIPLMAQSKIQFYPNENQRFALSG